MSHITNEIWKENRKEWLEERGREEKDVMDEGNGEFIMVEGEEKLEKVFLPDAIRIGYGE